MRAKIPIALVLFMTCVYPKGVGGYAGSFLRIGTTARSMAMGGGFSAAVDNGFAAYHNPASLPFLEKRHVSVLHHFLPLDRHLVSASFATSLPPTGGLGIGLVNAGVGSIDGRDLAGHQTGTLSADEYAIYFCFSNRILEGVSLGVNVKLLYHVLPVDGGHSSKGTAVDVGIMVRRFKNLDLGLVIQDLYGAYVWNTSDIFEEKGRSYEDPFPTQVRLGFVYRPGRFNVTGDYTYFSVGKTGRAHRIRMGGEFKPMPQVALRAGANNFSPAVGAGLNYSLLKRNDAHVDYAFILGRRGEGFSHIFTYVFTF